MLCVCLSAAFAYLHREAKISVKQSAWSSLRRLVLRPYSVAEVCPSYLVCQPSHADCHLIQQFAISHLDEPNHYQKLAKTTISNYIHVSNKTSNEQQFVFDCKKSDLCFVKGTDNHHEKIMTLKMFFSRGNNSGVMQLQSLCKRVRLLQKHKLQMLKSPKPAVHQKTEALCLIPVSLSHWLFHFPSIKPRP